MQTFFTSDTHFGHGNIITYGKRPFRDVEAMDAFLVRQWNAIVSKGDTVWHLGDFSMKNAETVDALLGRLNGRKHLVVGNHDRIKDVRHWETIQESAEIQVDGQALYLCHYPLREWPGMWRGTIHLYGHVHGNLQPLPGSMEVSSDVWGGQPVRLQEIRQAIVPFDADAEKTQRSLLRLRRWE